MILRNFLNDKGGLWFWRRQFRAGEVRTAKPESLFVEDNLYTIVSNDGARNVFLEHQFAKMEHFGSQLIAQLLPMVRSGETPRFDSFTWDFLHLFEYFMGKRSSAWHDRFVSPDEVTAVAKAIANEPQFTDAEREWMDNPIDLERVMKNARIAAQATPPPDDLFAEMRNRGLAFLVTPVGASFVLGDFPTAVATIGGHTKFGVDKRIIFMPIARDVAIGYLGHSRLVYVQALTKTQVRAMNEAMTCQSEMIAASSNSLVKSLSRLNYIAPDTFTTAEYLSGRGTGS